MADVIGVAALRQVIHGRIASAQAAGLRHVREPAAFESHLIAVASASRRVAERLSRVVPSRERPDPDVCFVAGGWHDAGKIFGGDDYHELTGAFELLTCGQQLGIVRGPDANALLRSAARSLLSHFALSEQLHDQYVPSGGRSHSVSSLRLAIERLLGRELADADLLPKTPEARVLIYCDISDGRRFTTARDALSAFDDRWRAIGASARQYDPAIVPLLPAVRPRIHAAYTSVVSTLLAGQSDGAGSIEPEKQ